MMDPEAEDTQHLKNLAVVQLAGTELESSKGHFTILLSHLLQDGRDVVRPVNSMSMGPLPHFIRYEVP